MSQELLENRWSETKEALLEGLQGTRRSTMGVVLENTRKHLAENATAGSTSSGNIATLNRVILPVIRRVMPTVIANELVGVQPMTGPVGQSATMSDSPMQSGALNSPNAGRDMQVVYTNTLNDFEQNKSMRSNDSFRRSRKRDSPESPQRAGRPQSNAMSEHGQPISPTDTRSNPYKTRKTL